MYYVKWLEGWKGILEEFGLEDNYKFGGVKYEEEENVLILRIIFVLLFIDCFFLFFGIFELFLLLFFIYFFVMIL